MCVAQRIKKLMIIPVTVFAAGLFFVGISARAETLEKNDLSLKIDALGKTYEFFYPEIDKSGGSYYLKNCEEVVDGIFLDTVTRATAARVTVDPEKSNPFTYFREKDGVGIDKEKLVLMIEDGLNRGVKEICAPTALIKPTVTVADLKKETVFRAAFSTGYKNSSAERKQNIALAAKYLCGTRVPPQCEFSFNKAVGERSAERGFSSAKIIENGKFTDGVGGGVCQVSSTVYNAALLAGLPVTERRAHSLAVGYVEPSFDAMVSTGYSDLKFLNDTGRGIYVVAAATDSKITVRIYGEKPTATYRRVSEITGEIKPEESEVISADGLFVGEEEWKIFPKNGLTSVGYLEKYVGGKRVSVKKLSSDKYAPVRGVLLKGVLPRPHEDGESSPPEQ